jgi:tripartite ATP-independent transporter DctP family solute receptor
MSRRLAIVAAAAVMLAASVASASAAEPIVLRVGHNGAADSLYEAAVQDMSRRLTARLGSRVRIESYGLEKLGNDETLLKEVRAGNVEMFVPSSIMSTVEAHFGVFEMPYLITSRDHARRIANNKTVRGALFAPLPAKGLRVLGMWENGFRHITSNVRPIVKPEDLKGQKLRVPSGVWRLRMFQAYGATPTALSFGKVRDALASGEMDAQENPIAQIWSGRFHEVQKYLSLSGHVYSPAFIVVSETVWQRLPADVQTALERAAAESGDFARKEGERLDRDLIGKMSNLAVNEVNRDAFRQASVPIYEQFASEVPGGATLIKAIQALR